MVGHVPVPYPAVHSQGQLQAGVEIHLSPGEKAGQARADLGVQRGVLQDRGMRCVQGDWTGGDGREHIIVHVIPVLFLRSCHPWSSFPNAYLILSFST
jgi:hypothetical protein